ncbi:hypothetical protein RhiJN_09579 [Ceratobasidium sp. AG-Ba]|nr:hypothetical protein RhiJN_09579 [Ceratobasidium sp. AG-Ba]QRW10355.1 hypothetical protein RhiLY_09354 [Ceratobasidium sp. AG-Ba]
MLLVRITHFIVFAASLQNSLLNLLGFGCCEELCAVTSLYVVTSTATGTLTRVYELADNYVANHMVQLSLAPWLHDDWPVRGPEGNPFRFLLDAYPFLDTGARTEPSPYATRWLDGVTPTSSLSALAPVHAYNAGLSASAPSTGLVPLPTPSQLPSSVVDDDLDLVSDADPAPPVPAATTPTPPDEWAFDGPLSTHPTGVPPAHTSGVSTSVSEEVLAPLLPLSSAGADYPVATPAPTVAATAESFAEQADPGPLEVVHHPEGYGSPRSGTRLAFGHGWALSLAVSIVVQILVTVYAYRYYAPRCRHGPDGKQDLIGETHSAFSGSEASSEEQTAQEHLRIEGLEDIPRILDEHGLSVEDLRAHIEMATRARRVSVRQTGHQAAEDTARGQTRQAQVPSLDVSVKAHGSAGTPSAADSQTGMCPQSVIRAPASTGRPELSHIDSVILADRILKISEDIRQGEERFGEALDELAQVAREYPRRTPSPPSPAGPSNWREIQANARRDEFNASPLAHKSRMPGRALAIHSRCRSETGRIGAPVEPMAYVEEPGSMNFDPAATSSLAHYRPGRFPAIEDSHTRTFESSVSPKALTDISTMMTISQAVRTEELSAIRVSSTTPAGSPPAPQPVSRQIPGHASSERPHSQSYTHQPHTAVRRERRPTVVRSRLLVELLDKQARAWAAREEGSDSD